MVLRIQPSAREAAAESQLTDVLQVQAESDWLGYHQSPKDSDGTRAKRLLRVKLASGRQLKLPP